MCRFNYVPYIKLLVYTQSCVEVCPELCVLLQMGVSDLSFPLIEEGHGDT